MPSFPVGRGMPANKTLACTDPGCDYQARRPLANVIGCRGHGETPPEPATCPHGHGEMIEAKVDPHNRKPLFNQRTGKRRRFGR